MSAIRLVFQTNRESDLDLLRAATARARHAPGCRQAEDFRSVEYAENLLHLQLWEDARAWDAYWAGLQAEPEGRALIEAWRAASAPHHHGYRNHPRRIGQNGVEFYKQARFGMVDGVWARDDPAERAESLRWPAWSAVRIVIQSSSEPGTPQRDDPALTRAEPGCVEFESFRGVEFPENTVLMETWASPQAYDVHWMQRLLQNRDRAAAGGGARPAPYPRRYGESGFEWHPLCYYTLAGAVWEPEDPKLRMATVYW